MNIGGRMMDYILQKKTSRCFWGRVLILSLFCMSWETFASNVSFYPRRYNGFIVDSIGRFDLLLQMDEIKETLKLSEEQMIKIDNLMNAELTESDKNELSKLKEKIYLKDNDVRIQIIDQWYFDSYIKGLKRILSFKQYHKLTRLFIDFFGIESIFIVPLPCYRDLQDRLNLSVTQKNDIEKVINQFLAKRIPILKKLFHEAMTSAPSKNISSMKMQMALAYYNRLCDTQIWNILEEGQKCIVMNFILFETKNYSLYIRNMRGFQEEDGLNWYHSAETAWD